MARTLGTVMSIGEGEEGAQKRHHIRLAQGGCFVGAGAVQRSRDLPAGRRLSLVSHICGAYWRPLENSVLICFSIMHNRQSELS